MLVRVLAIFPHIWHLVLRLLLETGGCRAPMPDGPGIDTPQICAFSVVTERPGGKAAVQSQPFCLGGYTS